MLYYVNIFHYYCVGVLKVQFFSDKYKYEFNYNNNLSPGTRPYFVFSKLDYY